MVKRTITGLAAGAYAIAMILLGKTALTINVVLMLLLGTYEVLSTLKAGGFKPVEWVHYVYVLLLVPAYLWKQETGLFLMVLVGLLGSMAATAVKHEPSANEMLAAVLPTLYPALPLMALFMLMVSPAPHWRLFVWMAFGLSVGSDAFALYFGRAFGKHKLIPRVSPNKTVEGAVGGFIGSLFVAMVIYLITLVNHDGISIWVFVVLAIFGSAATQIGDIVASYIKRFCGVKDFGKIFPGHGGLLDRMDGILFNALILCIFTMLVTV